MTASTPRRTQPRPRTYTRTAHVRIRAAAGFLTWLTAQNLTLAACRQADVDPWLSTAPSAGDVRNLLHWVRSDVV